MVVPVLLLTLGAAAVLYGSRRRGARAAHGVTPRTSPVSYQHLQLYQGGMISQDALETAKAELEEKLAHGGVHAVETCLRPGLQYVVQVRALTEIGTEEAALASKR